MKKCPTCEKTFDDNLKFCQTDGTPLVAVEEEKPEDPYKTTVANASDLPIPPFDPLKTMVAGPPPAQEKESPKEAEEDVLDLEEDNIDPMQTLVSTDYPKFGQESKPETKEEEKPSSPASPFSNANVESKPVSSDDISNASPEPPKFSEPDLNPPSFGDVSAKSEPPDETPSEPTAPPIETPSEPIPPKPSDSKPFEMSQPQTKKPNDFSARFALWRHEKSADPFTFRSLDAAGIPVTFNAYAAV